MLPLDSKIFVIIPAYNEQDSVGKVLAEIPPVSEVIVVDNNSSDQTAEQARSAGATVLSEPKQGYGNACMKGLEYAKQKNPDIVVFMDADYSDFPQEMTQIIEPILENKADLVIGSRILGRREPGSLAPQQVFGNWLATKLLHLLYGVRFTDLGPFRAIGFKQLLNLNMQDRSYGWTVEMQLKAAKQKLRCTEVPVSYRNRIGASKISGTLKGSVLAGYKIIWTILRYL